MYPIRVALLALAATCVVTPLAQADDVVLPPPPRPEDVAAIETLLEWSRDGAVAVRQRLSPGSPFAALPAAEADAEIEARLGAHRGEATWELQGLPWRSDPHVAFRVVRPSGLDEYVVFELVDNDGVWQVDRLVNWGEKRLTESTPGRETALGRRPGFPQGWLLVALALALGFGSTISKRLWWLWLPVVAIGLAVACGGNRKDSAADGGKQPALPRLAAVVPLRLAIDAGQSVGDLIDVAAKIPAGPAHELGQRWLSQLEIQVGRLAEGEQRLDKVVNETALDAILRGRLALLHGQAAAAEAAWDVASERLAVIDGMRLELSESLLLLGADVEGSASLANLVYSGSRLSQAWYVSAEVAAIDGAMPLATTLFALAWQLEPRERAEVVGDPVYAFLAGEAELVEALALTPVEEPPRPSQRERSASRRPIEIPTDTTATTSGELLRVSRGAFELLLPGSASLAPPGTPVADAAARRRETEQRAMNQVAAAREQLTPAAMLANPALRDRLTVAALSLARRGDWTNLVELTAGLDQNREVKLPPDLGRLRAAALQRENRAVESRELLVRVAGEAVASRRRDPWLFLHLAEVLLDVGAFDDAERAASIAERQLSFLDLEPMAPRIKMERQLAEDFRVHETTHFRLRYPAKATAWTAPFMGDVLEAELRELSPWLTWRPDKDEKIEVHLLWLDDFFRHYSIGGTAIASYDGALRLPFAAVRELPPVVHEILVHELVHALLDGATNGRAPSWFHEGLAQHLEPEQHPDNAIPDYTTSGRRISIPLVEAVFRGRPRQDLVSIAYDESLWIVRAIEAKWGREGIHKLVRALATNGDSEAALASALGTNFATLDAMTWQWVLEEVPKGRWQPRAARQAASQPRPKPPTRGASAIDTPLAGTDSYLARRTGTLTASEVEILARALESFEQALLPAVRVVVELRNARRANDATVMASSCTTLLTVDLPAPPQGSGRGFEALSQRAKKSLVAIDGLQGSCRRQAWGEIDQRTSALESSIRDLKRVVTDLQTPPRS